MSPEQLQSLAREAGFITGYITINDGSNHPFIRAVSQTDLKVELQRFVSIIRNATLEEAATACEARAYVLSNHMPEGIAADYFTRGAESASARCATTIRKMKHD